VSLAIEISDLSYTYMAGTPLASPALHGISLQILTGEIVALVGQTGAGKTTLLQICDGLLRPPASGSVRVLGVDTSQPGALAKLRLRLGLLFQRAEAQLLERFVGDDVAYGPRQAGLPLDEVRERVRQAMETVGLGFEEFKDRRSFNLSGGEMRKVALAGLLATRPELVLLDEPTAGLDPESRGGLIALVRTLRDLGATVVMSSSSMEDLPGLADRLIVLNGGRVIGEVAGSDIWRQGAFLRANGLDLPELCLILESLAAQGMSLSPTALDPDSIAEGICRTLTS
jgi:energy-coupling factor transporter ATP-binding protein EcfA2